MATMEKLKWLLWKPTWRQNKTNISNGYYEKKISNDYHEENSNDYYEIQLGGKKKDQNRGRKKKLTQM